MVSLARGGFGQRKEVIAGGKHRPLSRNYAIRATPPHEPKGRAGCPHPAVEHAGHSGRSRRGEDTLPYPPRAVQGFKARSLVSENSHLDPLPSSDEGRGNTAASVQRTEISVCERDARFPLPFGRGEDQGEGLLQKTFVSLPKMEVHPALSHAHRETFVGSHGESVMNFYGLG